MDSACNRNIRALLGLTETMISLADTGEADSADDRCVLLFGIVRDCAYRIRTEAEREAERHKELGQWDSRTGKNKEKNHE